MFWTDEDGNKVEIRSFFARVYVDETVDALNKKFSWSDYRGEVVLSSLGKAQREQVARTILTVGKLNQGWCGVAAEDLSGPSISQSWYVEELVSMGYLRKKKIMGTVVVFPTEKLMENQRVPQCSFVI
ncbi:MAG: hypothetical protein A3J47_02340 [Candidatus Yanofskybacteria bacterium RIFCSPHIGHO2_02_FULL_43_22]|uniref:Uncharacterized protein n=1 Tax=Candidatus Yanofskybacteria bacterium RIFCSPHIGHO2_02_FULL_43_22 TaxID=1802681 RepID=A0A1F8FKU4_9BACT|nr:MAG: hypothetical protein A3J47_02340 [Candidatus Yanofskybacteria bacterium RIFCSPHIGHO2_02_FULL_43_22]